MGEPLPNHLIRPDQHRLLDRSAEHLRRSHVDHQLELCGTDNWQLRRLCTPEYPVYIAGAVTSIIGTQIGEGMLLTAKR